MFVSPEEALCYLGTANIGEQDTAQGNQKERRRGDKAKECSKGGVG